MRNPDEVLRCATLAAKNDATEVRNALNNYIRDAGPNTQALRIALVALAEGFEATAHSGETYKKRVQAAKDALAAWDGDPYSNPPTPIKVGSRTLSVPQDLAAALDVRGPYGAERLACLGHAIAESTIGQMHDHEGIALRALSLYRQQREAAAERESAERVARLQFEAAEQNKIAEAIRAKARSNAT